MHIDRWMTFKTNDEEVNSILDLVKSISDRSTCTDARLLFITASERFYISIASYFWFPNSQSFMPLDIVHTYARYNSSSDVAWKSYLTSNDKIWRTQFVYASNLWIARKNFLNTTLHYVSYNLFRYDRILERRHRMHLLRITRSVHFE